MMELFCTTVTTSRQRAANMHTSTLSANRLTRSPPAQPIIDDSYLSEIKNQKSILVLISKGDLMNQRHGNTKLQLAPFRSNNWTIFVITFLQTKWVLHKLTRNNKIPSLFFFLLLIAPLWKHRKIVRAKMQSQDKSTESPVKITVGWKQARVYGSKIMPP